MLQLYGSLTSPYVRMVRMVLHELEMPFKLTEFNVYDEQHVIQDKNPLLRIPVLIDGTQTLFESRIITHYLCAKVKKIPLTFRVPMPLSIDEENVISVIYGVLEARLLPYMMRKRDPRLKTEGGYFDRMAERTHRGFAWLEERLADRQDYFGEQFGMSELTLIAAMEWMQKRQMHDWSASKRCAELFERFQERPSVSKTRFPDNAA